MCEPVSAVMGLGQAAMAVGGFQSKTQQTNEQNKQIAGKYNQQRVSYELGNFQRLAIQGTKEIDVKLNQDAIASSASNAISNSTLQESEANRRMEEKLQSIEVAALKGTGEANEGGRSRSFGKNIRLKTGQAIGSLQAQRSRLGVAGFAARREILIKAQQDRIAQWRQVNQGAGEAGPAPEMPTFIKGPSKLALGLQLAGAAATAFAPAFKGSPGTSGSEGALTEWNTDMAIDAPSIPYID